MKFVCVMTVPRNCCMLLELSVWFLHTHSEHWQHFQSVILSLAVGQIHTFHAIFLHLYLQLQQKLVYSHGPVRMYVEIPSIRPSSYIWSYHFFSQRTLIQITSMILLLMPIRISNHSTNADTQPTSIKVRNSFKGQCLVDLQVYSFRSLSWMSAPLSVTL